MKAIHADPREIRKLFTDKFVIPDFQRPYSWEIEHCDKLWDDFLTFCHDRNTEDRYFLGNIVIHPSDGAFAVIDGQQRLTTLLLLIKVLHQKAGTVQALEKCLKVEDPLTTQLTTELRVQSQVLEDDRHHLSDIIFNNGANTPPESKLLRNYAFLDQKVSEWWLSVSQSTTRLDTLILTLLDKVVLLPIHCGSEDDALTIFETINNRGMSLSDSDIFKAKLHHASGEQKDDFVQQWNSMDNHEWLFRIYMHILRAKGNDTSKETALRSFFSDKSRLQDDWRSVMRSLKRLNDVMQYWKPADRVSVLWQILETCPNYYWNFPLFVYLHKHGIYVEDQFDLPQEKKDEFAALILETVRYFFIKGVVYNSVNAVRDAVFRVCALIESGGNFLAEYRKGSQGDFDEFLRRMQASQYGRYQRGLVLINSMLNPHQPMDEYLDVLSVNYHVEHVLPRKWNNYDDWTPETWASSIDTVGNLMPLEWNLNISAKNDFFQRKKASYVHSRVADAKEMDTDQWGPSEYQRRQAASMERLRLFFAGEA